MSRGVVVAVALSLLVLAGALSVLPALAPPRAASPTTDARAASTSAVAAIPHPSLSTPTASEASRMALQRSILSKLHSAGVPDRDIYLPNFEGGGRMVGNVVAPITSVAPAPMGLGDFGVRNTTGTPQPYVIDSTSWEGTMTLNTGDFFYIDNDGPDTFGVQLNAVLSNVTVFGSSANDYWIQDVVFFTPSQDNVSFLDNIWNLSNPSTAEPASTFYSYNGTPQSGAYYYDRGPSFDTGFPFTVHLYVNASLTNISGKSYSTVRFGFDLVNGGGAQIGHGIYDTVLFNSNVAQGPAVPLPQFQVNGGSLTPTKFLLYDTELMIGGPGGGSTTQVFALNGSMSIAYFDRTTGHYTLDPSAWTAGTDTGETSQGVAVSYDTPGTGLLGAGPSFVEPLWNATPGGNEGRLRLTGSLSPDNAFLFLSPGVTFNATVAAWAPTLPGGTYTLYLPPGSYTGRALLADHDTRDLSYSGAAGGTSTLDIALPYDLTVGVDTPLFAWNNAELANLSYAGTGTVSDPYLLYNNQYTALSPLFGEMNDFLYPVFPGVLISETTAYFDLVHPAPFTVLYPLAYDARLDFNNLTDTNQLQIELYYTTHGSIIDGGDIGGWICGCQFSFPTPYNPDGEIVLWGATDTLVADNLFEDQGVGIVLMQGSGNVVWGNEFVNGLLATATFPAQFGIWEFESGDLIYNNVFDTSVTVYSPSYNMYNGNFQINQNAWNLSGWEPSSTVSVVNGFNLSGSVLGAPYVCGNWWWDYNAGGPIPYAENYSGEGNFILTGGDYCPSGPNGTVGYDVSFSETGLASGTWSVDLAGITSSAAAGSPIVFAMPNGTWSYSIVAVAGLLVSPASGSVLVRGHSVNAPPIVFQTSSSPVPTAYLATISETGLPAGTSWSIVVASIPESPTGSTVALTLVNGTYNYTVAPVPDYALASAATGDFTIAGAPVAVLLSFTPEPGWLNATVSPSNASVTVNGESVPLVSGAFTLEEMPGSFAIEATVSGYAPYFNNVTVRAGQGSSFAAHLVPVVITHPTGTGNHTNATTTTTTSGLTSAQFYGLIGGLLAVAIAIIVAAILLRRRGGASTAAATPEPEAPAEAPAAPPPARAPGHENDIYYEGPAEGDAAPPPR